MTYPDFKAYGPGPEGAGSLSAIVTEKGHAHYTAVTLKTSQPRRIELRKYPIKEFEQWFAPTPGVPVVKLAELFLAHAKHVGATGEALHVIAQYVDIPLEERMIMTEKNAAPDLTVNTDTGKMSKKSEKAAPAKKAANGKEAPAAAKKKGPPPRAKVSYDDKVAVFAKTPKDDVKVPPQMKGIIEIVEKSPGKKCNLPILFKQMESKIKTKQPIERIWAFYAKRLVEEGYLKVKDAE